MEKIVKKLQKTSTIKKDDSFSYSIKRGLEESKIPNFSITANNKFSRLSFRLSPQLIHLNQDVPNTDLQRRKNRYNTLEAFPPALQKKFSLAVNSPKTSKNNVDIPLNFSNSLSSSSKIFKQSKDDPFSPKPSSTFDAAALNSEERQEERNHYKHFLFEDNKIDIAEISSSKENSLEISPKVNLIKSYDKNKASVSFEIDKSECSIIYNSPDRYSIQPKLTPMKTNINEQNPEVDYTLETDKNLESPLTIPRINSENHEALEPKPGLLEDIVVLTFDEALVRFNKLPIEYTDVNLWHKDYSEMLKCCLIDSSELPQEAYELCEKIIMFAYSGFSENHSLHSCMLYSVFNMLKIIFDEKTQWVELGFSTNNPYEADLQHDMAAIGLLFLMFLDKYLPGTLKDMILYSLENDITFVLLAFDIAEIAMITLRKKKLNRLMVESQKCLEILFFFYAGCLAQWFYLHQCYKNSHGRINGMLEKQAIRDPKSLIELAKSYLQKQQV